MRIRSAFALVVVAGCAREPNPTPEVVILPPPAASLERTPAAPSATPDKVAECNALVAVINHGVNAVGRIGNADPSGVGGAEEMASQLAMIAKEVDHLRLTHPELRAFAAEYREMTSAVASAMWALAAAARNRDAHARSVAERDLDNAVKREDPLVDRINKLCQEH